VRKFRMPSGWLGKPSWEKRWRKWCMHFMLKHLRVC
jgi:hypothetical protein